MINPVIVIYYAHKKVITDLNMLSYTKVRGGTFLEKEPKGQFLLVFMGIFLGKKCGVSEKKIILN